MRITCPNCGAHYEVPESKLAGRKAVRCSRCGENWAPLVEDEPEAAALPPRAMMARLEEIGVAEAEPEAHPQAGPPLEAEPMPPAPVAMGPEHPVGGFTAMQRLAQAAEPPAPSIWLRVAWALSVILVVALLWSAFNWRADIMRVWPPSMRAYAALGLTPEGR